MRSAAVVIFATLVAGCAAKPADIKPLPVVGTPYAALPCDQITTQLAAERTTLNALSKEQNEQRSADAVGVLIIGVPIGSLANGRERETTIAATKGKIAALDAEFSSKQCGSLLQPTPPAT